jgi:hypothetical protein
MVGGSLQFCSLKITSPWLRSHDITDALIVGYLMSNVKYFIHIPDENKFNNI